jgi:hypothetical protein
MLRLSLLTNLHECDIQALLTGEVSLVRTGCTVLLAQRMESARNRFAAATAFVAISVIEELRSYTPARALVRVIPGVSLLAILGLNVRHDLDIEPATRSVSSLSGNVCLTGPGDLLIGYKVACKSESPRSANESWSLRNSPLSWPK